MRMNRRRFVYTSAGFLATLMSAGIWSCSRLKSTKKQYNFMPFESDQNIAPVLKVTPDDGYYVHAYFDVTPFSPSQRYMAVTKLPFQDRIPNLGETADVCVIDLAEQTIETVYSTKTWGFQTGSNVQWGGSDRYVYTNDLIDGKAVTIEIDLETGEVRAFSASMYNVARDGSAAIGFPIELLNVTQQGYGMPSEEVDSPPSLPPGAATDQGIWRTDLKTGESGLLYSLADVAKHVPETPPKPGGTFYFWHSKYNRQCTRIMQVLRCIFPDYWGERNPMVFTLDADGTNVHHTANFPLWGASGGHPNWHPNGDYIIRNMKPDGKTTRVCQVKYDGSEFKMLSETYESTGHPSIEPSGRYVITDDRQFTDAGATQSLILLDLETDTPRTVCTIPTIDSKNLSGTMKTLRLDGHPAWSRDYKKISLQAAHAGARQLYVVDMSELI